mmetsp:Transcript_19496/g.42022  ORF Transcript_19496/g.42022 Transcript_19496/m.42022 type:complete len:307 (+) Transcript_19496:105-1025(+)
MSGRRIGIYLTSIDDRRALEATVIIHLLRRLSSTATTATTTGITTTTSSSQGYHEARATTRRHSPGNLANHAFGRLTLQPYRAGAREGGQEHPLASAKHVGQALDHLNVVIHSRRKRHQTPRTDAQRFSVGQLPSQQGATRLDKHVARARQPLQDESFAAKKSRAQIFAKFHLNVNRVRRAQQRALLTRHLTAVFGNVESHDFAGKVGSQSDLTRAAVVPGVAIVGNEKVLSRQHALKARAETAARGGVHFDAVRHVHEGSTLGPQHLTRFERHGDNLRFVALHFGLHVKINGPCRHHAVRTGGCR